MFSRSFTEGGGGGGCVGAGGGTRLKDHWNPASALRVLATEPVNSPERAVSSLRCQRKNPPMYSVASLRWSAGDRRRPGAPARGPRSSGDIPSSSAPVVSPRQIVLKRL